MIPTQIYIEAFKRITHFKIKYKADSTSQKLLAFCIQWYIPTYLTHYTTVVGKSIYFPTAKLVDHPTTRFTLAHEVVHLLDQKRLSLPLFLLLYLSPQILTIGVLSFPWLGSDALWFLIFGLPWPSPGRVYLEARAYGLELSLYQRCGYKIELDRFVDVFRSSGYYFMSWSRSFAKKQLLHYLESANQGDDPIFNQVIQTFEACEQNSASSQNVRKNENS